MTEPQVRVTSYAVSCIPEDDVNAKSFTLRVERRGRDRWVVTDGFRYFTMRSTSPIFVIDYCFDMDTALEVANYRAPLMRIGAFTAADCLARRAAHGDQPILTTPAQDANGGQDACPP